MYFLVPLHITHVFAQPQVNSYTLRKHTRWAWNGTPIMLSPVIMILDSQNWTGG